MESITGFKGFDKENKCRGFQFEEGKKYIHEGNVEACASGFHFCEYPLDLFGYYNPNNSIYREVKGGGKVSRDGSDSKVAVSEIEIGAVVGIAGLVKAAIEFTFKKVKWTKKASATGDYSGASATGNYSGASATGYKSGASATGNYSGASATGDYSGASATGYKSGASATGNCSGASATGDYSGASATGNCSGASATGDYSGASATGNYSGASATGYKSGASATGDYSGASATGDYSGASATGDYSGASATGDYSGASATGNCSGASATGDYSGASAGKGSVALAVGFEAHAKGAVGSWITVTECKIKGGVMNIVDVKLAKVDGKKVKADTFYMLKGGKLVEYVG